MCQVFRPHRYTQCVLKKASNNNTPNPTRNFMIYGVRLGENASKKRHLNQFLKKDYTKHNHKQSLVRWTCGHVRSKNCTTSTNLSVTHKEFLPKPNDFLKFFLRNDLKWFINPWYLRHFDSIFLFWIQEKNAKFKWIRLTTRKSVLAQTRDTFMAHTPETPALDWLFDRLE